MADPGRWADAEVAGRLLPQVAGFAGTGVRLGDDIAHVEKVRAVGAVEAAVFYCARLLEALSGAALADIGLVPSPNAFSNLETLEQLGLLSDATRHWAHSLRRIGNDVRHMRRSITPGEADFAVVLAERWLGWFFCGFQFGARLEALTRDGASLWPAADPTSRSLVEAFESKTLDPRAVAAECVRGDRPAFLRIPAVPALLAEILLDRGDHAEAQAVLALALDRFPDDLRIRQLMGLYWSRTGALDRAIEWLEPLHARFREDEETVGILAGVYKRQWRAKGKSPDWLAKAQKAYARGWESSRKRNPYLGINAATAALWLGRLDDARRVAADVRRLLLERSAALAGRRPSHEVESAYWDRVTLAEAEVVLGELDAARRRYADAIAAYPERKENHKVSLTQLAAILEALGIGGTAEAFVGAGAGVG